MLTWASSTPWASAFSSTEEEMGARGFPNSCPTPKISGPIVWGPSRNWQRPAHFCYPGREKVHCLSLWILHGTQTSAFLGSIAICWSIHWSDPRAHDSQLLALLISKSQSIDRCIFYNAAVTLCSLEGSQHQKMALPSWFNRQIEILAHACMCTRTHTCTQTHAHVHTCAYLLHAFTHVPTH